MVTTLVTPISTERLSRTITLTFKALLTWPTHDGVEQKNGARGGGGGMGTQWDRITSYIPLLPLQPLPPCVNYSKNNNAVFRQNATTPTPIILYPVCEGRYTLSHQKTHIRDEHTHHNHHHIQNEDILHLDHVIRRRIRLYPLLTLPRIVFSCVDQQWILQIRHVSIQRAHAHAFEQLHTRPGAETVYRWVDGGGGELLPQLI